MHKRWIQAILLCHQLRQVFLFSHSADFGPCLARRESRPLGRRGPWLPRGPSFRPSAQLSRLGLRSPRRYLLLPRPCPAPVAASAGEAARAARPRRSLIGGGAGRAGRLRRRPSVIGRGRTSSRLSGRRMLRRGGV